jgi:hypothetical protein
VLGGALMLQWSYFSKLNKAGETTVLKKMVTCANLWKTPVSHYKNEKKEIYNDISYIYEHYEGCSDSIWDLKNELNIVTQRDKHKKQCYCFCLQQIKVLI